MTEEPLLNRNSPIYSPCILCQGNKDCSGYTYLPPEDCLELKGSKTRHRLIYIGKDYENWYELEKQLMVASILKTNIRLVLDREIPSTVLKAAAFSPFNIVQFNVNLLEFADYVRWVGNGLAICNNCGLYSIVYLNPVIPVVTPSYYIIETLSNLQNLSSRVILGFATELSSLAETDLGYHFDDKIIPKEYLEKKENHFICSEVFKEKFLSIVNLYAAPHKISLAICGVNEDCTGLGLEE